MAYIWGWVVLLSSFILTLKYRTNVTFNALRKYFNQRKFFFFFLYKINLISIFFYFSSPSLQFSFYFQDHFSFVHVNHMEWQYSMWKLMERIKKESKCHLRWFWVSNSNNSVVSMEWIIPSNPFPSNSRQIYFLLILLYFRESQYDDTMWFDKLKHTKQW